MSIQFVNKISVCTYCTCVNSFHKCMNTVATLHVCPMFFNRPFAHEDYFSPSLKAQTWRVHNKYRGIAGRNKTGANISLYTVYLLNVKVKVNIYAI